MESRSSFTAETVALQRAFESHRPAGKRLFNDPYADAFLRPTLRILAAASRFPGLRKLVTAIYDTAGGPGPRPSAIARTRLIDDTVTEAMADRRQCVLLGAGFDTRAYRLAALREKHVFEVDHPATQATKRAAIDRTGLRHAQVTYVPVDFECDDLGESLRGHGFDTQAPAVFVWEGVTNYLTSEAVDATLKVVRDLTPWGGTLIMTYVDVRVLDDPMLFPEARKWVRAVERAGEPWTFGLHPDSAEEFLDTRGFRLTNDLSTFDAGVGWFAEQGRREQASRLYRVAMAERPAA